jgi:hypothetical protein
VAGGYLLGRTKKMKLALMLGGMAAGRRAGGPGELLAQGAKLLGQSPELTRLSDEVRGRLLDAGKAAAVAVATRQVEALTERVTSRVGGVTDTAGDAVGGVGGTVKDVGRTVGGRGRRPAPQDEADEYDDEPYDDDGSDPAGELPDEPVDEADDEPDDAAPDERADETDEADEADDADEPADEDDTAVDEEEEAPPPPPRRRAARAAVGVAAAGKATGRRPARAARARQGRADG